MLLVFIIIPLCQCLHQRHSQCVSTLWLSVSKLSCMYQHYNCIIIITACINTASELSLYHHCLHQHCLHQHYHCINTITVCINIITVSASLYQHCNSINTITITVSTLHQHFHCINTIIVSTLSASTLSLSVSTLSLSVSTL